MQSHLFLASTPFNVLTATMVALALPDSDDKQLWLIDQPASLSPFMQAALAWTSSPFTSVRLASNKARGLQQKLRRKALLETLGRQACELAPSHVYTANDRRIEFQGIMAALSHHGQPAVGHYLDDGTYTYTGRKTHWLLDKIIDRQLKRWLYGGWWQQPDDIGCSGWIQDAHVAFPSLAHPGLQQKHLLPLPASTDHPALKQLAQALVDKPKWLEQASLVVVLPHDSVRDAQTEAAMLQLATTAGGNVVIKNHPRNAPFANDSPWAGYQLLPSSIPMEMLFPLLPEGAQLCGDVSSALLTSRWLRPDIEVTSICKQTSELAEVMEKVGVRLLYC